MIWQSSSGLVTRVLEVLSRAVTAKGQVCGHMVRRLGIVRRGGCRLGLGCFRVSARVWGARVWFRIGFVG